MPNQVRNPINRHHCSYCGSELELFHQGSSVYAQCTNKDPELNDGYGCIAHDVTLDIDDLFKLEYLPSPSSKYGMIDYYEGHYQSWLDSRQELQAQSGAGKRYG